LPGYQTSDGFSSMRTRIIRAIYNPITVSGDGIFVVTGQLILLALIPRVWTATGVEITQTNVL